MPYKVLVTDPVHPQGLKLLEACGVLVDVRGDIRRDELLEVVADYDVLIVRSRTKVDREVIDCGRRLKVIARAGAGLDNIDVNYARAKGIKVVNAPEALAIAVAELTIGLMLTIARHIHIADRLMKEGKWAKRELMGFELYGKTLGIIGFGNVGREVARRASAMGMRVLAKARRPLKGIAEACGALSVESLEELLRRSDIITLHVPLTPETYHMIGPREFELMKDGVIIINTSRGAVIDPRALLEALDKGKVSWAALDVYETEPPSTDVDKRLATHPRVVATPHIGAQTIEAQERTSLIVAEKVLKALGVQ